MTKIIEIVEGDWVFNRSGYGCKVISVDYYNYTATIIEEIGWAFDPPYKVSLINGRVDNDRLSRDDIVSKCGKRKGFFGNKYQSKPFTYVEL